MLSDFSAEHFGNPNQAAYQFSGSKERAYGQPLKYGLRLATYLQGEPTKGGPAAIQKRGEQLRKFTKQKK